MAILVMRVGHTLLMLVSPDCFFTNIYSITHYRLFVNLDFIENWRRSLRNQLTFGLPHTILVLNRLCRERRAQ